jgi:hypothetical protein
MVIDKHDPNLSGYWHSGFSKIGGLTIEAIEGEIIIKTVGRANLSFKKHPYREEDGRDIIFGLFRPGNSC